MNYKGYDIKPANTRGGKAGHGKNKTTTLQVREPSPGGFLLKKQIRYTTDKAKAIQKAKDFIDTLEAALLRSKRVRVTLEIDQQFIKLLRANIEMTKAVRGWLFNDEDAGDITPSQVLGLLVYMEGRGGTEAQISASTPFMWRSNVDVIHSERRVYSEGKQIAGPVAEPKKRWCVTMEIGSTPAITGYAYLDATEIAQTAPDQITADGNPINLPGNIKCVKLSG